MEEERQLPAFSRKMVSDSTSSSPSPVISGMGESHVQLAPDGLGMMQGVVSRIMTITTSVARGPHPNSWNL